MGAHRSKERGGNITDIISRIKTKLKKWSAQAAHFSQAPSYLRHRYRAENTALHQRPVTYIVEDGNWSIKWDGIHMTRELNAIGRPAKIETSPIFTTGQILHFGSSYAFETQAFKRTSRHNKIIVTFFHGKYGDDPLIDKRFDKILKNIHRINAIAVSTSIMMKRFAALGIPEEKLFLLPIGVDLNVFKPFSTEERAARRTALGIPEDAFVIGSFQKDGEGWGEGLTPKMIKGPDLFIDTVSAFNKNHKIFCMLSGPARGYVKNGLEEANIPYSHNFFENPDEVADLYPLLDAYIVTSREEGGPKAIVEAMACGTPLVTSDVGMARDILDGQDCGIICDVGDIQAFLEALEKIAQDEEWRAQMSKNSLKRVQGYAWPHLAELCEAMYKKIEG